MTEASHTPPRKRPSPAAPDGSARARLRRWAPRIMLAYLVALAVIAFWPAPVYQDAYNALLAVIDWLQERGAPGWVRYSLAEFAANVALFVPVGVFVMIMAGARGWWLAVLTGFAASCTIELAQLIFLPDRFATLSDVIANTIGAAVGAVIGLVLVRGDRGR